MGPQVLIPEAARDLEVPVEAGGHEYLLVELRALWEGVELPRVHSARNKVVTSALGRRLGEHGGLHLDEPQAVQVVASLQDQAVPEPEALLHLGATKVQDPVPETQLLRGKLLFGRLVHGDGGGIGPVQARHGHGLDLHLTGGHVRVVLAFRAKSDLTLDLDHVLHPQTVSQLERIRVGPVRTDGYLEKAGPVTQVDEDESTQVPAPVYPAGKTKGLAGVGRGESAHHP